SDRLVFCSSTPASFRLHTSTSFCHVIVADISHVSATASTIASEAIIIKKRGGKRGRSNVDESTLHPYISTQRLPNLPLPAVWLSVSITTPSSGCSQANFIANEFVESTVGRYNRFLPIPNVRVLS